MHGRGCDPGEHRRIGRGGQFAFLFGKAETSCERLVEFCKSLQHHGADLRIAHRFRRRSHHREATARPGFTGEIDVERYRIDSLKPLADRHFTAKNIDHGSTRIVTITLVAPDVEFALVAERAVEARTIHPGGGAEIVERSRCKKILPEQVKRLSKRVFRLIGARPAAAPARRRRHISLRPRLSSFLYHLAKNSLTQVILCETV